jgi:hypothetical protein
MLKQLNKQTITFHQKIGGVVDNQVQLDFMKDFNENLLDENLIGLEFCNAKLQNYLNNQEKLRGNPKVVYLLRK